MLTGLQIRAARAMLKWSATKLAKQSGVSYPVIQRAESGDCVPNMLALNLNKIKSALENAGVVFIDADEKSQAGGQGARMREGVK